MRLASSSRSPAVICALAEVCDGHRHNQELAVRDGVFGVLIHILQSSDNVYLLQSVLVAVATLAYRNNVTRDYFGELAGIEATVRLLKYKDMRPHAVMALSTLAAGFAPNQDRMRTFVLSMARMLESEDDADIALAMTLLRSLCAGHRENKALAAPCVPRLVDYFLAGGDLSDAALKALVEVAAGDPRNSDIVASMVARSDVHRLFQSTTPDAHIRPALGALLDMLDDGEAHGVSARPEMAGVEARVDAASGTELAPLPSPLASNEGDRVESGGEINSVDRESDGDGDGGESDGGESDGRGDDDELPGANAGDSDGGDGSATSSAEGGDSVGSVGSAVPDDEAVADATGGAESGSEPGVDDDRASSPGL